MRAETPARAWAEPGRCRKPTADSPCRGCGPAPDCTRKRRPWRSCKQAVVRESSAECGGWLTRSGGQRQPRGRAGGPSSRAGRGAGGGHRGPWAVLPPSRSRGPLGSGRQKARRRGRCGGRGGGGAMGHDPQEAPPTSLPCPRPRLRVTPSHSQRQTPRQGCTRALMAPALRAERPLSHVRVGPPYRQAGASVCALAPRRQEWGP